MKPPRTRTTAWRRLLHRIVMVVVSAALIGIVLAVSGAGSSASSAHTTGEDMRELPLPAGTFETRTFVGSNGQRMTYYLYGPAHLTPGVRYPLVLILHGGGERADPSATPQKNRALVLNQPYVTPFTTATAQQRWPSFVLVPQVPLNQRWVNVPAADQSYQLSPQPSTSLALAKQIVDGLEQSYSVLDPNRVYVEGISMGGFGVWEAAERWPATFAAGLPLAGGGDPAAASSLASVPMWAFHGAADTNVPVAASRLMVTASRAAGDTVCYTEYPNATHGIWSSQHILSEPTVLDWLFSQTKQPSAGQQPLGCPAGTNVPVPATS